MWRGGHVVAERHNFAACIRRTSFHGAPPRARAVVLAIALVCLGAEPGFAKLVLTIGPKGDQGGVIDEYVAALKTLQREHGKLVVKGECFSACTLIAFGLPRGRVCITRNAGFGFHSGWMYGAGGRRQVSLMATAFMWNSYPDFVKRWLHRRGGLTPALKYMAYEQASKYFRACH